MKFTWLSPILLSLCVLLACDNNSEPPPVIAQQQCQLISTNTVTSSPPSSTKYRYNTSGQLDRTVLIVDGNVLQVSTIEYEGELVKKVQTFRDSLLVNKVSTNEYTYLPTGQIEEVFTLQPVTVGSSVITVIESLLTLDAQSRVVSRISNTKGTFVTYTKYEYDESGNLSKIYVVYKFNGFVEEALVDNYNLTQEYLAYDEEINPTPPASQFMVANFSINNPLRIRYYDESSSEQLSIGEREFTYTYNNFNYPVSYISIFTLPNGQITGDPGRQEFTFQCK